MYHPCPDPSLQDDVVRLLEQYKKLALHYEALRAAVSVRHVASSEAAEPPVVLPALDVAAGSNDVLPPASDAEEPEASPGSMLKLLNPFTRVPKALKGTLSLLDGTTSLIPASAVAAWSTSAPKANLTLQEIPTGALDDVPSASPLGGAPEWQPPGELSAETAVPILLPEAAERAADDVLADAGVHELAEDAGVEREANNSQNNSNPVDNAMQQSLIDI